MIKIIQNKVENNAPWEVPLERRCAELKNSIMHGAKSVVLLYEKADTSTFRYRVYNIAQATQKSEKYRNIYFFKNEIDTIYHYLDDMAAIVLVRVRMSIEIDILVKKAKILGIPVLFDVDDLVFDTQSLPIVTNTLNVSFQNEQDYDFWFAYIGRIEQIARQADGFITTNNYLGRQLENKFNKPYGIIPNFLNLEQLRVSKEYLQKKHIQKPERPFVIGYFSGTPSHINDFKTVYRELMELLIDFPDMHLKVVGFMEFPSEMNRLIQLGRVSFTPLVDFLELQRLIAEVDINIVPLVDNTFTNCKSELKFFEAAIVETPTFAHPTFTYKNCITDGWNGFLCKPGEWYDKIKEFYLNQAKFEHIKRNGLNYVLKEYQGTEILKKIETCYDLFV